MGRNARRTAAAGALGLVVCAFVGVTVRGTGAQADAGTRAIEYLEGQQSATDGSLAGGFSVNDLYAIGAAAGGYDPHLLSHGGPSVIDYLTANAAAACPAPTAVPASAGNCGYLIQAALAAAADPRAFGGLDLVARLEAYFDPSTGKYGDGQAFTQALAIQALVAAGQTVPTAARTYLHAAEDSDGGWDYQDVPNDTTNPYDTSDTNSTAMVLMALDAAGDHSRDSAGLAWMHPLQNADGGFSLQGGGSDPDSTALVDQAILATGGSPTAAAWTVNGHTPFSELEATQDPSGGYAYPGSPANPFTTSPVLPALFGHAFPVSNFTRSFAPAMEHRAALNALLYEQSQQSATDGSLAGGFSVDDQYIIGAAAAGYDPKLLSNGGPSVVEYLQANADRACPAPTAVPASAGNCGALIQAVLAAALDPRAFGGIDLVARLTSYFDPSTGKYGDGQAFTQALAIQAVVDTGQPVPSAARAFLHSAEDSDGGWDYQDVPNDTTNPYDTSDTNSTAMVLMALDAAGDHSRDHAGLAWMRPLQNADGGFSLQGGGSDPDSTALVLQAILATGGHPLATTWAVGGHTAESELIATQEPSGGYAYPGTPPSPFTTSQVTPALAGYAYPLPAAATLYVPGTPLGGPPPAVTPTPSPAPSPSITAGPITPPPASGTGSAAARVAAASRLSAAGSSASAGARALVAASAPIAAAAPVPSGTTSPPPPAPRRSVAVAATTPGLPGALLYALVAIGAAVLVTGAGVLIARR